MRCVLLIVCFLMSFVSAAFEVGQPFLRINIEKNNFETAFRSYKRNADGKIVRLLGTTHIAEANFYARINNEIEGKTVLYELQGQTIQENRQQKAIVERYGAKYYKATLMLDNAYWIAKKYNLSQQILEVNYDLAQTLIHADQVKPVAIPSKEDLDAYFLQQYMNIFEKGDKRETEPTKMISAIFKKHQEDITTLQRLAVLVLQSEQSLEHQKINILPRNQIVKNRLLETISTHAEVIVYYGATHHGDLEAFLLSLGFVPIQNGEEWVQLFAFPLLTIGL